MCQIVCGTLLDTICSDWLNTGCKGVESQIPQTLKQGIETEWPECVVDTMFFFLNKICQVFMLFDKRNRSKGNIVFFQLHLDLRYDYFTIDPIYPHTPLILSI